jgi:hypothetical protein
MKPAKERREQPLVKVRLAADELQALDSWIAARDKSKISRPEAIRQLVHSAMALDREWEAAKRKAAQEIAQEMLRERHDAADQQEQ